MPTQPDPQPSPINFPQRRIPGETGPEDADLIQRFATSWRGKDDRGVALVIAAHLNEQCGVVLRRLIGEDFGVCSPSLDQTQPLARFSARIDLLNVFGQLSDELYQGLHLIRTISEDFADSPGTTSFGDPIPKARCAELLQLGRLPVEVLPKPPTKYVYLLFAGIVFADLMRKENPFIRATRPEWPREASSEAGAGAKRL